MSHQVRIVAGPKEGSTAAVSEDRPVFIGRDDACELAVPEDNTLSRSHAEVLYEGGEWRLLNRSKHGTLMNGEVFQDKRQLTEGAEFQVGATKIVFEADPNAPAGAPAADSDDSEGASASSRLGMIIAEPSNTKWIIVGGVVAILVVIGGGVAAFLLTR